MNQAGGIVFQVLQSVLVVLIAPLMLGWVNQCRAWLQNKSGAGIVQPYRVIRKLLHKDAVIAYDASPLFRATPYVLFIGSARPHKNLAALLRAFEMISASVPHDLLIVGGLDKQRTADSSIHALIAGLGRRVRVLEDVDDESLVGIVANADALVMPSLYEGFGLPALEAMAAGCPCLVSSAASLPEVCGNAAVFFDPRDPSDIAQQLSRVLDDASMRANLSAAGRARAAEFPWESTAERTVAVLERSLGAGK